MSDPFKDYGSSNDNTGHYQGHGGTSQGEEDEYGTWDRVEMEGERHEPGQQADMFELIDRRQFVPPAGLPPEVQHLPATHIAPPEQVPTGGIGAAASSQPYSGIVATIERKGTGTDKTQHAELEWQRTGKNKQKEFKEQVAGHNKLMVFLFIREKQQGQIITMVHGISRYYNFMSSLNGTMLAFVGDRTATMNPTPVVALPDIKPWEWVTADISTDWKKYMEKCEEAPENRGQLWKPEGLNTERVEVPRMIYRAY